MQIAQPAKGPWSVSLHPSITGSSTAYCPEKTEIRNAYNAMVRRGSSTADYYLQLCGPREGHQAAQTGQGHRDRVQQLRHEMSMVTKMAANVENVQTMMVPWSDRPGLRRSRSSPRSRSMLRPAH